MGCETHSTAPGTSRNQCIYIYERTRKNLLEENLTCMYLMDPQCPVVEGAGVCHVMRLLGAEKKNDNEKRLTRRPFRTRAYYGNSAGYSWIKGFSALY